jgi:SNF2 family DNA or RNA helicase
MRNDVVAAKKSDAKTYALKPGTVLGAVDWGRVVFDEAQALKNGSAQKRGTHMMFEAAMGLNADIRWALSGTPIENDALDYLSLLMFIRDPNIPAEYTDKAWFKAHIPSDPDKVIELFRSTMLRRTKGLEAVKTTPTKNITTLHLLLSEEDRARHAAVLEEQSARSTGNQTLAMITRSRQLANGAVVPCGHVLEALREHVGALHTDEAKAAAPDKADTFITTRCGAKSGIKAKVPKKKAKDVKALDAMLARVASEVAWYKADKQAILDTSAKWVRLRGLLESIWSLDDQPLEMKFAAPAPEEEKHDQAGTAQNDRDFMNWDSDYKKNVRVECTGRSQDAKIVIFSCFPTRNFELAKLMLDDMGIKHVRLDGTTKRGEVKSIIGDRKTKQGFTYDPSIKVMLVGLKSGGTGINLQVAQFGVLLDLWWNPSVERQAIDRVHRVGSPHLNGANYFFKFCADDTDEGKIVHGKQVQKQKLFQDTIDTGAETDTRTD